MNPVLRMDRGFWNLAAADLAPLAGYFLWHWLPVDLVFLFWVETLFLFLMALAAALFGPKPPNFTNILGGTLFAGWFLLIFLMFVCALDPRMDDMEKRYPFLVLPRLFWQDNLWPQVSLLAGSYLYQAVTALLRPEPGDLVLRDLLAPAERLVILFLSIFLGLLTLRLFPDYGGVFLMLLALKGSLDIGQYWRRPPAKTLE
ncbi:MAG TPA: DUF6498-containing protein [bacterium]|nr:DUF6498-containing protein [bacterium]